MVTHRPNALAHLAAIPGRVALARALARTVLNVLLADEATGSRDPHRTERLVSLCARLKSDRNMSTVPFTYGREAARMADRVMVVEDTHQRNSDQPHAAAPSESMNDTASVTAPITKDLSGSD